MRQCIGFDVGTAAQASRVLNEVCRGTTLYGEGNAMYFLAFRKPFLLPSTCVAACANVRRWGFHVEKAV